MEWLAQSCTPAKAVVTDMIEICYHDDEAVDASYTQDSSPAILSEFEQPEEEPAAEPALAFESLATVTSNDSPGHDPVRAYLRKMSSVDLLTREGEVELGKRMEDGQRRILLALLSSTVASHQLLEMGNRLRQQAHQSDASTSESEEHLAEPHEAARTERISKVMDDVQRLQSRLLKAENAALSVVKTTRERASREVAMLRHEMADALLSLRLDRKPIARIISQLRSLMSCIEAARCDIAYCEQRASMDQAGGDPNETAETAETARVAEILDNARKAIQVVEAEAEMPEQVLRDTIEEIRQGELQAENAKAEMVKRNLRLVIFIAKKYINHSELHFMDLVQEGNIGLIKAVERFDYAMGFKFATYATWWVRQAITFAMAEQSRTIRIPVHMVEVTNKLKRTHRQLLQKLGREATAEEMATEMELPVEKIRDVLNTAERTVSLDTPVGTDGDAHLGDFIEDQSTTSAFDSLVSTSIAKRTREILATLSPREQEVLRLRFGIGESPEHTLEEVGKTFALTRERIRQIEVRGLEKLRQRSRALGLHTFIEGHRCNCRA